jgi:hypothetical protein
MTVLLIPRWQSIVVLFAVCVVSSCKERPASKKVTAADSVRAPTSQPDSQADSVRRFVQQFYDWYVPLVVPHRPDQNVDSTVQLRDAFLDTALVRELDEDLAAKKKAPPGELEGINFDPFLNSQDPCPRYVAGLAQRGERDYFVDVRPDCGASAYQPKHFIAVVRPYDRSFRFADFQFDSTTLRKVLAAFKARRDSIP